SDPSQGKITSIGFARLHLNCVAITTIQMCAHCVGGSRDMKEISRSFSPFFLAAILLVGVGCSKKPNDAQVSTDVQNKFSQDSGLSDKQLTVQASNGVVTLAGTVDNEAQRDAAATQAASIPGVREVVNNLQVGSSTATA